MVTTPELIAAWEKTRDNPKLFIKRLHIEDRSNRLTEFGEYLPEQLEFLDALLNYRRVIGIKPRQVGWTTLTMAFFFWKALTSSRAVRILQMVNDDTTVGRLSKMLRVYRRNLPYLIRPQVVSDNREVTEFAHNNAGFHRMLAGGGGQARGWTFTDMHATEMGKWRSRTATNRNEEGDDMQDETWGSALATIHDRTGHVVVESTATGPFGMFYDLYKQAVEDDAWRLVFVPWTAVGIYKDPLDDIQAAALEKDLDDYEAGLVRNGVTLPQIAWRRRKIRSERISPQVFRREYPLDPEEPFLLAQTGWFDAEVLSVMMRFVTALGREHSTEPRIFHDPQPHRRYVLAMDTSGGRGRDEAVIHLIRDDLLHCATWATSYATLEEQAQMVARLYGLYHKPLVIIEANYFGMGVIERVQALGVSNLWRDDRGRFFHTTGGAHTQTKRKLMVHAREVFDNHLTVVGDHGTLYQAKNIVEKTRGRIEASGSKKDDRIMAYALGLWAARGLGGAMTDMVEDERRRLRFLSELPTRWGSNGPGRS